MYEDIKVRLTRVQKVLTSIFPRISSHRAAFTTVSPLLQQTFVFHYCIPMDAYNVRRIAIIPPIRLHEMKRNR